MPASRVSWRAYQASPATSSRPPTVSSRSPGRRGGERCTFKWLFSIQKLDSSSPLLNYCCRNDFSIRDPAVAEMLLRCSKATLLIPSWDKVFPDSSKPTIRSIRTRVVFAASGTSIIYPGNARPLQAGINYYTLPRLFRLFWFVPLSVVCDCVFTYSESASNYHSRTLCLGSSCSPPACPWYPW